MPGIPQRDIDEGILNGVIDIHVHAGPCIYGKDFDEVQTAEMLLAAGYRGVLFKQHVLGANRIEFVRRSVPGLEIFGGIALNHYVGGLNPFAVASCITFGGRDVKFPNIHAANHVRAYGSPTYVQLRPTCGAAMEARMAQMAEGITIYDDEGKLVPNVHIILDLIAEADIGVETGHLSKAESLALVKAAREHGVKKIWQTHANWWKLYEYSPEEVKTVADAGAFIELAANFALPNYASDVSNWGAEYAVSIIKAVGADRCVMATDGGIEGRSHMVDEMRVFIREMQRRGIQLSDIEKMTKKNPAYLLGLAS